MTAHLVAVSPLDRSGRRTSLIGEQLEQAMPATEWLEEAVLRHSAMLLAAARALTAHEADARDLVQGTIEIALRKGGQIRDREALPAWLLTVQAREALKLRRRLRRFLSFERSGIEPVADPPGPEAAALLQALAKLSPRVRAVVVLHHMAGLSVADVAAGLGVSPNTVKTQLKSGLASLRRSLADE